MCMRIFFVQWLHMTLPLTIFFFLLNFFDVTTNIRCTELRSTEEAVEDLEEGNDNFTRQISQYADSICENVENLDDMPGAP